MMEPKDVLKQFGLTDTETKVYLTLLKLGETTVPEIVKKVKAYKANVYDALDKLEKKGLVTHLKKEHRMFYTPLNPEKLYKILDSRKESLESVFPILDKFYKAKKTDREVNILSGRDGIKTIFNDMHTLRKDIYTVGSSLQLFSVMEHRAVQFLNKLDKDNFKVKVVMVDKKEIRQQASELHRYLPVAEFRFYPEKFFSPVTFAVYGNRAVMMIWDEEPLAIWIKDRSIAEAFRNYFAMIWMVSKD